MFRRWNLVVSVSAAVATVLLVAGCTTLGPDYEEPEVEWLQQWQPDLYGHRDVAAETAADLSFWWRLFNDPTLNELVQVAKAQNLPLRLAGLRILESRAALGAATGAKYPQVQQFSGTGSYVNSENHGGVARSRQQDLVSYQSGFNIGWELDFWGRFQRGIESAEAVYLSSVANQHDVQVLLSAQIAKLYYAVRTLQLRIEIARENAQIQQRSFEITQELYRSGEDSELDLQQAKTQYLATLSSIPSLEISLTQTRNALSAILGRAPGDLPELDDDVQNLPTMQAPGITGLPAEILLRRPDVRAAAWQVAAQSAQIGIAEADLFPAISLFGSIGWSGNTLGPTPDVASLAAGPSFTWNLFDHGLIRNNVRLQDVRLQQAIESFQNVALQSAQEIDNAAISLVKTREQQEIVKESLQSAQRSLALANARYREGYAGFQRVLDAQRALAAQSESELLNRSTYISAVIDLYKALGGGWEPMTTSRMLPADIRKTMQSRTNWGDYFDEPSPQNDPASSD